MLGHHYSLFFQLLRCKFLRIAVFCLSLLSEVDLNKTSAERLNLLFHHWPGVKSLYTSSKAFGGGYCLQPGHTGANYKDSCRINGARWGCHHRKNGVKPFRTEDLVLQHTPGWPKAGWRGVHPEQVEALDQGGFREVESFSFTVDISFTHTAWRGRMRTCNGVGSALDSEQLQAFDSDLATLLTEEFPGLLSVPHRIFATSGVRA